MPVTLADKNVAILVADGFDEHQMTEIQRALTGAGARTKTVAQEPGVVNGWQGEGWGHHYPVDVPIGEALGSDFDMLVLPGGARGFPKLRQNLHAKRIINHFLEANKPIAAIGAGVALLALGDTAAGRIVAAPTELHEEIQSAGLTVGEDNPQINGNLMTADGADLAAWVEEAVAFFADADLIRRAA